MWKLLGKTLISKPLPIDAPGELGKRRSIGRGRALGERALDQPFEKQRAHLQIVPRVRAVERFVAKGEVRHDVAFDRRFEQRPLEP